MVLWQCDLRISWRAQWVSLLIHGLVAAIVLLLPWPLDYLPVWLLLLSLVVFDCVRSQRRINNRHGEAKLLECNRVLWQGVEWDIIGSPWVMQSAVLFRLRKAEQKRRHYLWMAQDSMDLQEWRDLRRILQQSSSTVSR